MFLTAVGSKGPLLSIGTIIARRGNYYTQRGKRRRIMGMTEREKAAREVVDFYRRERGSLADLIPPSISKEGSATVGAKVPVEVRDNIERHLMEGLLPGLRSISDYVRYAVDILSTYLDACGGMPDPDWQLTKVRLRLQNAKKREENVKDIIRTLDLTVEQYLREGRVLKARQTVKAVAEEVEKMPVTSQKSDLIQHLRSKYMDYLRASNVSFLKEDMGVYELLPEEEEDE